MPVFSLPLDLYFLHGKMRYLAQINRHTCSNLSVYHLCQTHSSSNIERTHVRFKACNDSVIFDYDVAFVYIRNINEVDLARPLQGLVSRIITRHLMHSMS
jgi:hypothetical protein